MPDEAECKLLPNAGSNLPKNIASYQKHLNLHQNWSENLKSCKAFIKLNF